MSGQLLDRPCRRPAHPPAPNGGVRRFSPAVGLASVSRPLLGDAGWDAPEPFSLDASRAHAQNSILYVNSEEGHVAMKTILSILFAALLFLAPVTVQAQPVETELPGITAEVVELRQAGGVLRLAVRFANSGTAEKREFDRYTFDRIVLVDVKSKRKHLPIKDANGQYIGGPIGDSMSGGRIALKVPNGQSTVLWAYFEPVTAGAVMNVEVPYVFPFDNVPVTEGTGKVFASGTAGSTPSGVRATIVSARRADQVVNMRLRIAPEKGETADTLHNRLDSYFYFKDVFLFDPVAKRKYPLVKDTEGYFQAQPLTVKMDGGRFIHNWRQPRSSASRSRRHPIRFSGPTSTCPSSCLSKP